MRNITIESGIVKKCGEILTPLRGYDLVVIEDQKYEVVPEGQKKERTYWSFLSKKKPMAVFGVSTDAKHLIEFKKTVNHSDGIHSFFIDIAIDLKVGISTDDKTTLIKRIDKDPVQIIKDEAYKIIARYLNVTDWNRLSNDQQFQSIRNSALEDMVAVGRGDLMTMFDAINAAANQYGLVINDVNFDITIPDTHLKDKIVEDRIKIKEKIKIAEIEIDVRIDEKPQVPTVQEKTYENELIELERIQKIKDITYDTAGSYIEKVGQNIAEGSRSIDKAIQDIKAIETYIERDEIRTGSIIFDSLFPSPFHPNLWQDLLVYLYNESALEKVKADLEKRLKDMSGSFDAASDKSKAPVPENALLTIIPEIKDVACNPPQAQVYMTEDYHCVPFRVKYEPQSELASVLGRGEVHGRIKIFLEGLLIGEIPIESPWRYPGAAGGAAGTLSSAMSLVAHHPPQTESSPTFNHAVGYRYRKIFVSYSRKDTKIVKRLEKAYKVIGDEVWRDVYSLKSGTQWSEEIKKAILEADVFQLFWSENARQSENVAQEWRTALSRDLPHFIRPVYWQEPLAPLPEELKMVAFTFLEV